MGQAEDNVEREDHIRVSAAGALTCLSLGIHIHRGSANIDETFLNTDADYSPTSRTLTEVWADLNTEATDDDRPAFEAILSDAWGSRWSSLPDAQRLSVFRRWKR